MWRMLIISMFSLCLLGAVYIIFRFHKLSFVQRIARKSHLLGWLACLLPLAVSACFLAVNVYAAVIVFLHLIVVWLLSDAIGFVIKKLSRRTFRRYWAGAAALAFTAVYLGVGWFCAHHVFLTRYTFTTDKLQQPLRVALVADSHLGITQNGKTFDREMQRLQQHHPDVLVLAGDFVDDDSSREDMLAACEALGRLELPYGVYFIYGNHDKGYFHYRNFSTQELDDALARNGVVILEDASVLLDDRFYLIGRQDRTERGRADMSALTQSLDTAKYMILLDHQPNDYAAEAASGVDLVLSGHTHGGHIFPAGQIGLLMGANDRRYGTETRSGTTFVVTSGISGWAIPFKTGTFSETVLIDLVPANP